jgi:hypothetical protein
LYLEGIAKQDFWQLLNTLLSTDFSASATPSVMQLSVDTTKGQESIFSAHSPLMWIQDSPHPPQQVEGFSPLDGPPCHYNSSSNINRDIPIMPWRQ